MYKEIQENKFGDGFCIDLKVGSRVKFFNSAVYKPCNHLKLSEWKFSTSWLQLVNDQKCFCVSQFDSNAFSGNSQTN